MNKWCNGQIQNFFIYFEVLFNLFNINGLSRKNVWTNINEEIRSHAKYFSEICLIVFDISVNHIV